MLLSSLSACAVRSTRVSSSLSLSSLSSSPSRSSTSLLASRRCASSSSSSSSSSSPSAALNARLADELASMVDAGTFKRERVITTPQRASISVRERDAPVLNFCANNYLGLADDAELRDAAKRYLDDYGLGLASVRFICGTQSIHKELERRIARFHGTDDAVLYGSCFDANAGIFEALLTPDDAVLSDALNHASIIDGVRLCKATKRRFEHMNLDDLDAQLRDVASARTKLIVTDGVFSMDGDIAPLREIAALADRHGALLLIDECHATGFLGPRGRGTAELLSVPVGIAADAAAGAGGGVHMVNSTLGKALGGATGGYTAASAEVCSVLRNRSRPYLFSNTMAPALVGAAIALFDRLEHDTSARDRLADNVRNFRTRLLDAGFTLRGDPNHPIIALMLGDARVASRMADELLTEGIYVIGFSYPVVPQGAARIRIQLSAAHSDNDLERALDAFIRVGKRLDVIA